MGTVAESIRSKLDQAFAPQRLEIHDDSAKHSGHAGAREGGESHFSVLVVSAHFEGLNRVARQRLINTTLAEELTGPVHALSLQTLTPAEYAAQKPRTTA
jgi:BolA protein